MRRECVMASNSLYPDPLGNINKLLKSKARARESVKAIVNTYVTSPGSPLDGSLHPSLQPFPGSETTVAVVKTDDEVKVEEDAFIQAMKEYESTANEKYRTGVNPDSKHTRRELETAVAEAIKKYELSDSNGIWGKIRNAFSKLGDKKDDVEGWLGLLPGESEYFSVICGGLKLIVQAAARINHVHVKVLEALYQVPLILDSAQRVLNVYPDSERLKALSRAFYMSILGTLGHLLGHLRQKASKRKWTKNAILALINPATFEKDLLDKIDKVTTARNAFNDEAGLCQMEMLNKQKDMLHKLTDSSEQKSEEMMVEIRKVDHTVKLGACEQGQENRAMCGMVYAMNRKQSDLGNDMATMKKSYAGIRTTLNCLMRLMESNPGAQYLARARERNLDAPEDISDIEANSQRSRIIGKKKKKKKTANKQAPAQHRRWLLAQLDYDRHAAGADLTSNCILGPTLLRDDQERSVYVIKSAKLAAWVTAGRSTTLIVNGNAQDGSQRTSAMAFVCGRLVFALEQLRSPGPGRVSRPDIVPLYFFCGRHASSDRSWETPSGILNSLLAQLLTRCKDLDLAKAFGMGGFDSDDVAAVFRRFGGALAQLPSGTTVVCVIEGLPFYLNNGETSDDAEELLRELLKLGGKARKSRRMACVFKLLLTATKRFHTDETDALDDDKVLNIPVRLPSTGGFNEMKWHLGIGQQLEETE
ncbi:hypothetical protein B0T17DRAFT_655880 [Bombardia bombarda]|uniref:Uncharacterized protein n=1 Tax=Bombardia bombarda TaxID=252184 RepID=A0AA40C1I1_9PEZI|nr:hypothetical protein B0T17DRAFT_655880 [Bombardia bombarda]